MHNSFTEKIDYFLFLLKGGRLFSIYFDRWTPLFPSLSCSLLLSRITTHGHWTGGHPCMDTAAPWTFAVITSIYVHSTRASARLKGMWEPRSGRLRTVKPKTTNSEWAQQQLLLSLQLLVVWQLLPGSLGYQLTGQGSDRLLIKFQALLGTTSEFRPWLVYLIVLVCCEKMWAKHIDGDFRLCLHHHYME